MVAKKRHKSFAPKVDKAEPITFTILDEEFEAYPQLQGAVIIDLLAGLADTGEEGNSAAAATLLTDIFEVALKPESLTRFKALTHDPERIVDLETLSEIVAWLMEEYTDRPTEDSSR